MKINNNNQSYRTPKTYLMDIQDATLKFFLTMGSPVIKEDNNLIHLYFPAVPTELQEEFRKRVRYSIVYNRGRGLSSRLHRSKGKNWVRYNFPYHFHYDNQKNQGNDNLADVSILRPWFHFGDGRDSLHLNTANEPRLSETEMSQGFCTRDIEFLNYLYSLDQTRSKKWAGRYEEVMFRHQFYIGFIYFNPENNRPTYYQMSSFTIFSHTYEEDWG